MNLVISTSGLSNGSIAILMGDVNASVMMSPSRRVFFIVINLRVKTPPEYSLDLHLEIMQHEFQNLPDGKSTPGHLTVLHYKPVWIAGYRLD